MSARVISIWFREDCPADLAAIIPRFEDDFEPVIAVAHIPQHVLESQLYEMSLGLAPYPPNANPDPRTKWFSEGGVGLFGANAIDFYPHPKADGHVMVCRNV